VTREFAVPELSLVVLVGISGAGKSTFGRAHFRLTKVIFSDFCHRVVADDENGRDTSSARRTAPVGLAERACRPAPVGWADGPDPERSPASGGGRVQPRR
jgi:hypothetical protein